MLAETVEVWEPMAAYNGRSIVSAQRQVYCILQKGCLKAWSKAQLVPRLSVYTGAGGIKGHASIVKLYLQAWTVQAAPSGPFY